MEKIKINFCDFWDEFDYKSHFIYNILQKFYSIEISEEPDFLIYSIFGIKHLNYNNCVKIFYTGESVVPNFNECDYAIGYDDISFDDRYIRYNIFYKTILNRKPITKNLLNRKFCNFIYSNANIGEGATLRQEFFKQLSEYKHIDAPGKVCNNMSADNLAPRDGDWYKSKIDFIGNYKFTIAFENCASNGYITEKLFQPLNANSIPIYWGAPDVAKDFNTKAFINCNDYKNFDEIIEKIKYLDNNDEAYLNILKEPLVKTDSKFINQEQNLEKFLVNIISKGPVAYNKDPVGIYKRNVDKLRTKNSNYNHKYFLQYVFSVKNEPDKKHKVVTILGIKIKIKRKH